MNTYQFVIENGTVIELLATNEASAIETFFSELPYSQDDVILISEIK
jgi:hypothetical protein